MKLYHGTNQPIDKIDLTRGAVHKDFGQGFYLTPDQKTAQRMAKKRTWLSGGEPVLLTYDFDEKALADPSLKVKQFTLGEEWIEFVNLNRDKRSVGRQHDYDIVIGPIANDGVAYLLGRWNEGTMPLEVVLEQLRGRFLDTQYYFGTERALSFLKLEKTEDL